MPLNPNIILGGRQAQIEQPDPIAQYSKGLQLKGMLTQQATQDQALADDQAQRAAFASSGGDSAKYLQALASGGNYRAYQAAQKADLDTQKAKGDIAHVAAQTTQSTAAAGKSNVDAQVATIERVASILGTAKDPQSYAAARQAVGNMFPQALANLPPQYDPMLVQSTIAGGMKRAEQLKAEHDANVLAETGRHNRSTEANTVRGQNMVDARSREATAAVVGKPFEVTGPDGNPALVQQDRAGNISPVQGYSPKTVADKPLNDSQSKALLFGTRAQEAHKILDQLAAEGTATSIPGSRAPVIGGAINAFSSGNQQMLDQAKRDFMTAILRRESGASISSGEFDTADKLYFPQVGERDPKVIAQKQRSRDLAIKGILAEVPEKQRAAITPKGGASGSFDKPAKTSAGATVSNW